MIDFIRSYKILFALIVLLVVFIVFILTLLSVNKNVTSPGFTSQNSAPSEQVELPTFDTAVGSVPAKDLTKSEGYIRQTTVNSTNQIEIKGASSLQNDIVVTKDQKVVFQRKAANNAPLSELNKYIDQQTKPEAEFTGSNAYGEEAKTVVYASKGFAAIINPLQNSVYEIQQFQPTTVDQYKKNWGSDIHQYSSKHLDP